MQTVDLNALEANLRCHVGARKSVADYVAPALVERLAVTLGGEGAPPRAGAPLPPGWHTIFCLQAPGRAELGDDGLPLRYDLLPPVPMLRRLFGGARLAFHAPLTVGEAVRCESELSAFKVRATATAHLAIATLRHQFFGSGGLAVVEEQDIVHMQPIVSGANDGPGNGESKKAESKGDVRPAPTWQRSMVPDTVTLFRFSALTFNSHRIHYDAPYAQTVEKLPGLVVQGKLIALSLLETVRRAAPDANFKEFQYRSIRPIYADRPCTLTVELDETGTEAQLRAEDAAGVAAQTASLRFAAPLRR